MRIFNIQNLFYLTAVLSILWSCVEDETSASSGRVITIAANIPSEETTRASLMTSAGTLSLTAEWDNDDQIAVFTTQNGKTYNVGIVPLTNISDNRKHCFFEVTLPELIDTEKPFVLKGYCGIGATMNSNAVSFDGSVARASLAEFKAPLAFEVNVPGPQSVSVDFKHIGSYEILHIKNKSERFIKFVHKGFQAERLWYKEAYSSQPSVGETFGKPLNDIYVSRSCEVPANGSNVMVSWYVPTGSKIYNARLLATIDGKPVTSIDTKTSSLDLQPGHAYHMYVTWDGENLRFDEDAPVEVSNFEVTKANYYPNYFTHEGRSYSFRYYCTAYITLKDAADLEDWGYIYIDPDGKESAPISLVQYQNSPGVVGDPRYSYYRNEPTATVKLKTYVKRRSQTEPIYGDEQEFTIEYPSVCSISMNSCTFQGTTFDEIYGGRMYKYKTTYRFVFSASGAYWMKVRTDERGLGWTDWPNLPNRTMSPVDGNKANALTVNYYYDDKTMTGDFQVYLMGDDATHGICYTSLEYVDYHHDGSKFTGFTYHPASSASNEYPSASRSMANDDEIPVLNVVLNKVNPN